jgi:hypothetical protein
MLLNLFLIVILTIGIKNIDGSSSSSIKSFVLQGVIVIVPPKSLPLTSDGKGKRWAFLPIRKDPIHASISPHSAIITSSFPTSSSSSSSPTGNLTIKEISSFANMADAAYSEKAFIVPEGFQLNETYGWNQYGPRMHIFISTDNTTTVAFAIKGTTIYEPFGDSVYNLDRFEASPIESDSNLTLHIG